MSQSTKGLSITGLGVGIGVGIGSSVGHGGQKQGSSVVGGWPLITGPFLI
ncbi:hypothetical protein [Spiroplasma endosymbiont of Villa modesta]